MGLAPPCRNSGKGNWSQDVPDEKLVRTKFRFVRISLSKSARWGLLG